MLCRAEVAVIVFAGNKKLYEFASTEMKDVLYRYTQVPNFHDKSDVYRLLNHTNIVVRKILPTETMEIRMIRTILEWTYLPNTTESCLTHRSPMELLNSDLTWVINDDRVMILSYLTEDNLCIMVHLNFYHIERLQCIRDILLSSILELLRNISKSPWHLIMDPLSRQQALYEVV